MADPSSRSIWYKLNYYLWPYTASNKISLSIYTNKKIWLCYRIFSSVLALILLGFCILETPTWDYLFFFGSWNNILTLLFFLLASLNYIYKGLWKFTHILYEITWCFNWTSLIVYWAIIYPSQSSEENFYISIAAHGGLLFLLILDALNNHIRFFSRHLYLIIVLSCVYFMMQIIYTLERRQLYRVLSYNDVKTYFILIGGLFLIWISFLIGLIFDKIKFRHARNHSLETYDELTESNSALKF